MPDDDVPVHAPIPEVVLPSPVITAQPESLSPPVLFEKGQSTVWVYNGGDRPATVGAIILAPGSLTEMSHPRAQPFWGLPGVREVSEPKSFRAQRLAQVQSP